MKKFWQNWKKICALVANFQIKIILELVYFILILPYSVFFKLSKNPFRLDKKQNSNWTPHPKINNTFEELRKQY